MNQPDKGFLVVLSDVKAEHDRDYVAWLTTEHVQERLAIPGFLAVRIFSRPVDGARQFFIWYQLENADVVDSAPYIERLNNPTPWSRRIMPLLGNFGRAGGTVSARMQRGSAEFLMVAGLEAAPPTPEKLLDAVASTPGVRSVHFLQTDLEKTALQTNERALRSSDNTFAGLLLVEADSQDSFTPVKSASLLESLAMTSPNGICVYQQIFGLQA